MVRVVTGVAADCEESVMVGGEVITVAFIDPLFVRKPGSCPAARGSWTMWRCPNDTISLRTVDYKISKGVI
jgi:hypothetical protein